MLLKRTNIRMSQHLFVPYYPYVPSLENTYSSIEGIWLGSYEALANLRSMIKITKQLAIKKQLLKVNHLSTASN